MATEKKWTDYWFGIVGEDSDLYGEEFFTELETDDKREHVRYAKSLFPNEKLRCYGKVTPEEAEMMGLDTY